MPHDGLVRGITFGAGAAIGCGFSLWLQRRRRSRLPRPSECPAGGVAGEGKLSSHHQAVWVFFGNHLANLDFYNATMTDGDASRQLTISYPARLKASAGFMRAWGHQSESAIGAQTASIPAFVGAGSERAHDLVGVIVPFGDAGLVDPRIADSLAAVPFAGNFDWLGWTDPPAELREVRVLALDVAKLRSPNYAMPILQSHVDVLVTGALRHGEAFAAEWLGQIQFWSIAPPPSAPRAPRRAVKNFLVGFGSIIQTASRAGSDPSAVDAAPCRIAREWGYVREWNFQAATAQICALGLRRTRPGERGATINGVLFPAPDDLAAFDARENGYARVEVDRKHVELLGWHELPEDAKVFCYVPYAAAVVAKYGDDPATGLPRCSGAAPPWGLRPDEAPGLGLVGPSVDFPILQTYVDVCVSGCLEHGEAFAREFLRTTFLWSCFWLNEREVARRPWLHQKSYVKIDQLLREEVPAHFAHRKLESEYAVYLAA
ncbi:hypothetical protein AURANDRAFT_61630 [Aureococcus anophagefferens]|uniref:Uncharacterized protein n=1 Tax=Aureococcus anophagefferens TaxID=44056 RepID=F0Y0T2_AURAN|nr:hypothetical protein AURANDRAFT_61630 [Aureococcus anophagefferens]EGB11687.1 hypothetical protein AURANDRAFT_61630 [Aureococcus anophagefferens]|eukprot:XP_009034030.1 hypothetical protein AURANDRAFT_61630 [Aureococcus anophagefferens]